MEIQIQQGIQQSEHNHCSYKRFWEVSVHSCLYVSIFFCVFNLLQVSVKEKLPKNDPTFWDLVENHSETYIDSKNTTGDQCH